VTPDRLDPRPVRTVFLGSGRFGVESLRRLWDSRPDVELVGVVTAPPRPAGRRQVLTATPIHLAADELAVPAILTPQRLRSDESIAAILALQPELVVLADYGQIVPAALLDLPHGALNLHPSLLPRYRGATPVQAAILAGDDETGVTLMRMDPGLDTGPIVAQSREPLDGTETAPILEERLMIAAAALLRDNLGPWLRGEIVAVAQGEEGASSTRPLRRDDGRLDLARTASELERQVRAYVPWPGTFVEAPQLGRLIVDDATLGPAEPGDIAGRLVADGPGLALATADGRLRLGRVRVAGRKPMSSADLLRGAPGLVGSIVR
jgi:methionyl-tRNA formyltransferase